MTTYTITAEQLQQLLACVKAMYNYAGCRVHMQSYADQSADSLALLRKLQPNTQEPVASLTVSNFRGHLTNHEFDYFGDLPAGDYSLYPYPAPQAKPLTNDELWTVWDNYYTDVASYDRQSFDVAFLRAVLAAAHNIGVKP